MRHAEPLVMRPFRPDDARFVRALATEAFAEYDGGIGGSRVLAMAIAPRAHTVVAEAAGRRVGFAVVTLDGHEARLGAIAVVREMRGRGIGEHLVRAVEAHVEIRGARVVQLETGEANLAAMDLFVRAGYQRTGRIARYYRTGYDALIFRKRIGIDRLP